MKLTAIDKEFGVAGSTGQGKSKMIRRVLKICTFDHRWTLPSQLDTNPMVWMLQADGYLIDMRTAPLALQRDAYEKGLIPYVPAERMVCINPAPLSTVRGSSSARSDC